LSQCHMAPTHFSKNLSQCHMAPASKKAFYCHHLIVFDVSFIARRRIPSPLNPFSLYIPSSLIAKITHPVKKNPKPLAICQTIPIFAHVTTKKQKKAK
jgi:hypothetical protein